MLCTQDESYLDMLTETVSRIKRVLEELDPSSSGAGKMVSSTFYLIGTHPRTGLTCCRLSQDQAALQCCFLTPDDLQAFVAGAVNLFEQVGLHLYCVTLKFCGSLISRISRIRNHSQKYTYVHARQRPWLCWRTLCVRMHSMWGASCRIHKERLPKRSPSV